jgi:hypothetical protein
LAPSSSSLRLGFLGNATRLSPANRDAMSGVASIGPSFSASRVLQFGELSPEEQEAFTRFFCEQRVQVR